MRPWSVPRATSTDPSRSPKPPAGARPSNTEDLGPDLIELGLRSGLARVGIAAATEFVAARHDLVERRRQGLNGDMQFTYRNPSRSTDPTRILDGARSLVVGAWSYRGEQSDEPRRPDPDAEPGTDRRPVARVARYARHDYYADLRRALTAVAQELRHRGWRAVVVCDDNALVDRAAAHRAGIGWYGKNSLILLPGLGSWFVLGSVVTDAPLLPGSPVETKDHASGCGSCTRCLTACPTGALVEPGILDARRCLAWLVQAPGSFPEEYRDALGDRIYGCDDCQQICPINKVTERKLPPEPTAHRDSDRIDPVDLIDLLEATDDQLMATHGRWYIADRDPRYLRRNALVALGNVGEGDHPATARVLAHWLADGDPMLVEHARWAATKLGRMDLIGSEA